jgi:hypothetical protein
LTEEEEQDEKGNERIIEKSCAALYPVLINLRYSFSQLLKFKNTWPVPVAPNGPFAEDHLFDCIQVIKKNPKFFFVENGKINNESVLKSKILKFCNSTWEDRAKICHFKVLLADASERTKIMDRFKDFQYWLDIEISSFNATTL